MFASTSDHTILEISSRPIVMERRWKSNVESAPNCPRCASSNTKFCYYNNYSLSQPRYFCKGCRRYWTKGGSLRNVPVGGGCRRNRRSKSARQTDRLGLSYQMPSPGSTSDEWNNTPNGSDIDLAAVFAKFLNQDNNSGNQVDKIDVIDHHDQESYSSGASCTSLDVHLGPVGTVNDQVLDNIIFESQKSFDHLIDGADDQMLDEGLPPLCVNPENFDEFFDQSCNAFELQDVLSEAIGDSHTMLSDETSLPNLEWQSVMQSQDFGSFSTDDGMKFPSNLADDSWSSFDMGYEIFSRPWN